MYKIYAKKSNSFDREMETPAICQIFRIAPLVTTGKSEQADPPNPFYIDPQIPG
jgi:hypothetical protein